MGHDALGVCLRIHLHVAAKEWHEKQKLSDGRQVDAFGCGAAMPEKVLSAAGAVSLRIAATPIVVVR
jgi:hypothetical protein